MIYLDYNTALSNTNLILSSQVENRGDMVSNLHGTTLYIKRSFLGRVWQVLGWIMGTGETTLEGTLTKTQNAMERFISEKEALCAQVNDPSSMLGNYWKTRDVKDVSKCLGKVTTTHNSLAKVDDCAKGKLNSIINIDSEKLYQFQALQLAGYKIKRAELLVDQMKLFGNICPVETLNRELLSNYPQNDEELAKLIESFSPIQVIKYNHPNCNECDAEVKKYKLDPMLIYSPLVDIAKKFAEEKNYSMEELKLFIKDFNIDSPVGKLLTDMIAYLKDRSEPKPELPTIVLKKLDEPYYCGNIHCVRADEWSYRHKTYKLQHLHTYPSIKVHQDGTRTVVIRQKITPRA